MNCTYTSCISSTLLVARHSMANTSLFHVPRPSTLLVAPRILSRLSLVARHALHILDVATAIERDSSRRGLHALRGQDVNLLGSTCPGYSGNPGRFLPPPPPCVSGQPRSHQFRYRSSTSQGSSILRGRRPRCQVSLLLVTALGSETTFALARTGALTPMTGVLHPPAPAPEGSASRPAIEDIDVAEE